MSANSSPKKQPKPSAGHNTAQAINEPLCYKDWLQTATAILNDAEIETARLDALVLLEKATGHERSWLLAHDDRTISEQARELLTGWLTRRARHEPLAYILQAAEFYGRTFYVDPRVLVPRPESETILELLQHWLPKVFHSSPALKDHVFDNSGIMILDIGTGSGALAISAKLLFPTSVIYGNDIDPQSLAVAQINAKKHHVAIHFYEANMLINRPAPLKKQLNVIMANLPYVPNNYAINKAAGYEPSHALFGGDDGLDLYRQLFAQTNKEPQLIITESLPFQHAALREIAAQHGYQEADKNDFIQVFIRA